MFRLLERALAQKNDHERRALGLQLLEQVQKLNALPVMDKQALFLLQNEKAKEAAIAGEWTGWQPTGKMQRLNGTGLWYLKQEFPADARLEYKLVVDGEWLPDPLHSNRVDNGVGGENSWFAMPRYRLPRFTLDPHTPNGRIENFEWNSDLIRNRRTVFIYLPAKAQPPYPLICFHDGNEYRSRVNVPHLLDTLIARKRILPIAAIFIPPVDRMADYWRRSSLYMTALASELLPELERRYGLLKDPHAHTTAGASLGGYLSLKLVLEHPGVFGNVISQSGAFQVDFDYLNASLQSRLPRSARLWLDYGTFENDITDTNRKLERLLRSKPKQAKVVVSNTGHNWTAWTSHLPSALEWVCAK